MVYSAVLRASLPARLGLYPITSAWLTVPDREDYLGATGDLLGDEPVQLVLLPAFAEEGRRQNDYAEAGADESLVDLAAQIGPDPQLKLVVPDRQVLVA